MHNPVVAVSRQPSSPEKETDIRVGIAHFEYKRLRGATKECEDEQWSVADSRDQKADAA